MASSLDGLIFYAHMVAGHSLLLWTLGDSHVLAYHIVSGSQLDICYRILGASPSYIIV